jgi:hypothetical protein
MNVFSHFPFGLSATLCYALASLWRVKESVSAGNGVNRLPRLKPCLRTTNFFMAGAEHKSIDPGREIQ